MKHYRDPTPALIPPKEPLSTTQRVWMWITLAVLAGWIVCGVIW